MGYTSVLYQKRGELKKKVFVFQLRDAKLYKVCVYIYIEEFHEWLDRTLLCLFPLSSFDLFSATHCD